MQSFCYFPAIVYRDEQPHFIHEALPTCMFFIEEERKRGNYEKRLYQTRSLIGIPELNNLSNYLLQASVNILKEQGYDVKHYDFFISELWAQETSTGLGTNIHNHPSSQICGWYFLETPENGSIPAYYDTRLLKKMVELRFNQGNEITNATNAIYFNSLVPGTTLFSNSWMQHSLLGGNSDEPTRCIHFIVSHKERMWNI